jgi:hypothetical protein
MKPKKTENVSKTTTEKQVDYVVPKVGTAVVSINNHMVIIQV